MTTRSRCTTIEDKVRRWVSEALSEGAFINAEAAVFEMDLLGGEIARLTERRVALSRMRDVMRRVVEEDRRFISDHTDCGGKPLRMYADEIRAAKRTMKLTCDMIDALTAAIDETERERAAVELEKERRVKDWRSR